MFYKRKNGKIDIEEIGGKAFNLVHLNSLNINVPKWTVLNSECFYEFLGDYKQEYISLLKSYTEDNRIKIIQLIEDIEFSNQMKKKILNIIYQEFNKTDKIALRSSANDEDGENFSFAGMLDSFFNININEDIFNYIKKCYISCFSKRAMEYRNKNNLIKTSISVSVIIQQMVEADYSGVIFTTNPQTNNTDETFISVVAGLGENLVSGNNNSTNYIVDCLGNITNYNIADNVILKEDIIKQLYEIGQIIEKSYSQRKARDIEFCIKNSKIFILQSRLITNYNFVDKNKFRTILDNSNIIESYSGVTTPLTFTFAKDVYAKVYKQTLKEFFVSEMSIKAIEDDLNNMLSFYENKIYYRLNSWYKMTALYPSYEKNKKYMENMMGIKTTLNETKKQAKTRKIKIYIRFIYKTLKIKKDSKHFIENFNNVTKNFYANKFEGYSNIDLIKIYNELETKILDDFIVPITNDMATMVFFGILTDKLKKTKIYKFESILNNILNNQGNVASVKQSIDLINIVKTIEQNEKLLNIFKENNYEKILQEIKNEKILNNKMKEYIYNFGPRTIDELKLETITMLEDPRLFIDLIKKYIDIKINFQNKKNKNNNDEQKLYKQFHLLNKLYVKILVKTTKFFIKNRESLRLRRTYIFSIVRNIFLRTGKNLEKDNVLNNYRDIFYLEKDEIFNMINKELINKEEIKHKIIMRKNEFNLNKEKKIYERIYFYGDISPSNALPIYNKKENCLNKNTVLKGIAGGGQAVTGIVKYVTNPNNTDINGYILMAKRTDPGWITLFPMAKAIIIERGSILSHSAVVAREMGITLVVGITGLTDIVKDGMKIKVDGINGTIEIIGEKDEAK